jgi:serine protease AprX
MILAFANEPPFNSPSNDRRENMARYCIVATDRNLQRVVKEVEAVDGHNIKVAKYPDSTSLSGDSPVEHIPGMVFAELNDAALAKLRTIPGLSIKNIQKTRSDKLLTPSMFGQTMPPAPPTLASKACYDGNAAIIYSRWAEFRRMFTPPLTGQGLTCAVFGSGIRKTHRTLENKVVYEANFSSSPTVNDVFDHDTATAYLIAGGELGEAEQSGLSPSAKLWNIKCLNDDGEGTTEDLILAMAHVQDLYETAMYADVPVGDPTYVNAVNISLGAEDDGDPDNPIRIATEKLYHSSPGRFPIFAAAGNSPTYCLLPAAHEHVWAVGSCSMVPFRLSEFSARGSKLGLIKPEVIMYGENLMVASSKSNDAFSVRSGTSFSCPLCLGVLCLIREAADRIGELENILYVKYEDLEPYVAAMCTKPTGNPLQKEDGLGYGLPMGNLFAQEWQGVGVNANQMMNMMMPMMAMAIMGTITAKMGK